MISTGPFKGAPYNMSFAGEGPRAAMPIVRQRAQTRRPKMPAPPLSILQLRKRKEVATGERAVWMPDVVAPELHAVAAEATERALLTGRAYAIEGPRGEQLPCSWEVADGKVRFIQMRFCDRESARVLLAIFARLGHLFEGFAIREMGTA